MLFVAAFLFWGVIHPELLFYHEFYQMFIFDKDYFYEHIALPGGLCDYLAEFITQFYFYPLLGAFFIATLYVVVHQITIKIFNIFEVSKSFYPFSLLPTLFLWGCMCDENFLICFVVAALVNMVVFWCVELVSKPNTKLIFAIFCGIFSYWFIGPCAIIIALLYVAKNYKKQGLKSVVPVMTILLEALIVSRFVSYPISCFYLGIDYTRFPFKSLAYLWFYILCPLLPVLLNLFKKGFSTRQIFISAFAIIVLGLFCIPKCLDSVAWQTIRIYSLVYKGSWDDVIDFYNKHLTPSTYAVQGLNLALAHKGVLTDKMFCYYQPGSMGLISTFKTDMFTSMLNCEIFFRLGAYNLSQRYAFESQENISNFRNSSKLFVRLGQTAIVNKQYKVARKYFIKLSKTLFYKDIAMNYYNMLGDEKRVEEYPEFAFADKVKLEKDGVQEDLGTDEIFENLIKKYPKNYLAIQYYQASALLEMNYKKLCNSLPFLSYAGKKTLPKHVQEALVYFYYNEHKSLKNIPQGISHEVISAFEVKRLEDTFWRYAIFVKNHENK